ncbi:acyltransferase domain-containing protein [Micromonospora sp. M12]
MTAQTYRRHFPHRLAVAARDVPAALAGLRRARCAAARRPGWSSCSPGRAPSFRHGAGPLRPLPVGAGQPRPRGGAAGPGSRLDLRDVLVDDDPHGVVHRTDVTQPALALYEVALGRLLLSWGVRPAAMIGHSVGEFPAAALAGELADDDMLRLVATRAAHAGRPGGSPAGRAGRAAHRGGTPRGPGRP